ncbi:MAG: peptidoglycan DD-metalloendopeptidase family protein [Pseudomonadota bacterium]
MRKLIFPLANALIVADFIINFSILPGPAYVKAANISDPNQEQIKKVESRLSSEKQKLEEVHSQEKGLLAELASLEQEVAEKRSAVNELSQRIHRAKAEISVLKNKLVELKESSGAVEIKISRKLVELYKHTRIGYVRALADVTDISQFWRRIKYLRAVMEEDRIALIRAAEQAQEHQEKISRTEAELTEIRGINSEKNARLTSLRKELEEKVLRLMKIHKEKEFYETAVLELQAAAENLKQTLLNIEKKDDYKINQTCHFEAFKGKLPYPLKGRVTGEQKRFKSAGSGAYKGIIIECAPNSDVKAVFPGKIAFSGTLKGYGEVVIINHGSRFFTVSAHLAAKNKLEGDAVKEGEVLGKVAGNGSSGGGRLYFEIRRAGKSLNPQEWLEAK